MESGGGILDSAGASSSSSSSPSPSSAASLSDEFDVLLFLPGWPSSISYDNPAWGKASWQDCQAAAAALQQALAKYLYYDSFFIGRNVSEEMKAIRMQQAAAEAGEQQQQRLASQTQQLQAEEKHAVQHLEQKEAAAPETQPAAGPLACCHFYRLFLHVTNSLPSLKSALSSLPAVPASAPSLSKLLSLYRDALVTDSVCPSAWTLDIFIQALQSDVQQLGNVVGAQFAQSVAIGFAFAFVSIWHLVFALHACLTD